MLSVGGLDTTYLSDMPVSNRCADAKGYSAASTGWATLHGDKAMPITLTIPEEVNVVDLPAADAATKLLLGVVFTVNKFPKACALILPLAPPTCINALSNLDAKDCDCDCCKEDEQNTEETATEETTEDTAANIVTTAQHTYYPVFLEALN